jgi:hypothetical protein
MYDAMRYVRKRTVDMEDAIEKIATFLRHFCFLVLLLCVCVCVCVVNIPNTDHKHLRLERLEVCVIFFEFYEGILSTCDWRPL